MFSDDTFFVTAVPTGTCTLQAPCHDPAAVLHSLVVGDRGHLCNTVTSIQVSGSIVTGHNEARNDILRSRGIERAVGGFMAKVRDGTIVSFFPRNDLTDPQTTLNAAISAGAAQPGAPIPAPEPRRC